MAHLHRSHNFMNTTEGESDSAHAQLGRGQIQKERWIAASLPSCLLLCWEFPPERCNFCWVEVFFTGIFCCGWNVSIYYQATKQFVCLGFLESIWHHPKLFGCWTGTEMIHFGHDVASCPLWCSAYEKLQCRTPCPLLHGTWPNYIPHCAVMHEGHHVGTSWSAVWHRRGFSATW